MCRGLTDTQYPGGYRCKTHSKLGRTAGRLAKRTFGELTPETRARIEALPPKVLSLTAADRVSVVATSKDPDVWEAALHDATIAVRSALALNKAFRADPTRLKAMAAGHVRYDKDGSPVTTPQPPRVLTAIEGKVWKRDRRKPRAEAVETPAATQPAPANPAAARPGRPEAPGAQQASAEGLFAEKMRRQREAAGGGHYLQKTGMQLAAVESDPTYYRSLSAAELAPLWRGLSLEQGLDALKLHAGDPRIRRAGILSEHAEHRRQAGGTATQLELAYLAGDAAKPVVIRALMALHQRFGTPDPRTDGAGAYRVAQALRQKGKAAV